MASELGYACCVAKEAGRQRNGSGNFSATGLDAECSKVRPEDPDEMTRDLCRGNKVENAASCLEGERQQDGGIAASKCTHRPTRQAPSVAESGDQRDISSGRMGVCTAAAVFQYRNTGA